MALTLSEARFRSLYRQLDTRAGGNHPFVYRSVMEKAATLAAKTDRKPNELSKAEEKIAVGMLADGLEERTLSDRAAKATVRAALVAVNPRWARAEITISKDMNTLPKDGRRIVQYTASLPEGGGISTGTFGKIDIGARSPNSAKRVLTTQEEITLQTTGRRGATPEERRAARAKLDQYFGYRPG